MNSKGEKSIRCQGQKGKTHPDGVDQKWFPWKENSEAERTCCLGKNNLQGRQHFNSAFKDKQTLVLGMKQG